MFNQCCSKFPPFLDSNKIEKSMQQWYHHPMINSLPNLPINTVLPEIHANLEKRNITILAAEPGSGKTTIVPLTLPDKSWLNGLKIIMLEPRRLAARMAAKRMSELAGDVVGGLIGYRIRFDNKISKETRIEVITEGVFLRMIQNDPELSEVGLVIFDEFHERSIQTDLALAFCLDTLELRDDLKIMLMSATIASDRISQLLENAPIIKGEGRCFPVSVEYLARESNDYLIPKTVRAIQRVVEKDTGDILVFLPGAGEIRAVAKQIEGNILILPLYGDLPQHQQDLIFKSSSQRRIILATPIAETSLTIEGISVVIDSGLMKKPYFSPANSLSSLRTISISKASAKQRSGRAGRLGPGRCYRLWTKTEHYSKPEFLPPEILTADLSPLLLEVLQWGVKDPSELKWLDPPRQSQIGQAQTLLKQLGAIDAKGTLTETGRKIAKLPLHPRLALMLLQGHRQKQSALACKLAALLQNRDLLRGNQDSHGVDIEDRLEILQLFEEKKTSQVRSRGADPTLCKRILREAAQYQKLVGPQRKQYDFGDAGNLLAFAYPERIAKKKAGTSMHLLASGRGVILPPADHLHKTEFLLAANVDGGKKQGRIFLAAAISLDDITKNHSQLLTKEDRIEWTGQKVETANILSLGKLEIKRKPLPEVDPEKVCECLLSGIRQSGPDCLHWRKKSLELRARIETAHALAPENWPDVSDNGLMNDLSWLAPYLNAISSLKQLRKLDLQAVLLAMLSWKQQQNLDTLLPTHYQAPSGSRIKMEYTVNKSPVLPVRIQEMFGATDTPVFFNGKLNALVHLLSPARRPVQVTADLASFWKNTYPEVKKELAGRYPKHYWPDNPLVAEATARCKPRS